MSRQTNIHNRYGLSAPITEESKLIWTLQVRRLQPFPARTSILTLQNTFPKPRPGFLVYTEAMYISNIHVHISVLYIQICVCILLTSFSYIESSIRVRVYVRTLPYLYSFIRNVQTCIGAVASMLKSEVSAASSRFAVLLCWAPRAPVVKF